MAAPPDALLKIGRGFGEVLAMGLIASIEAGLVDKSKAWIEAHASKAITVCDDDMRAEGYGEDDVAIFHDAAVTKFWDLLENYECGRRTAAPDDNRGIV